MVTLLSILKTPNEDKKIKSELNKIINKLYPSEIIEKNLNLLKSPNQKSLLSLLRINYYYKAFILSEILLIEDTLGTGIYNSKYGNVTCVDILNEKKDFFPLDNSNKKKTNFKKILSKRRRSLINLTLYEAFNSLTLGGKKLLIECMDKDYVKNIIKSNRSKLSKIKLIKSLNYCINIRNFLAHNSFVLPKENYIKMVDKRIISKNNYNDEETIKYLFSFTNNIHKITGRGDIISKTKKLIKEIDDKYVNFNLVNLDIF